MTTSYFNCIIVNCPIANNRTAARWFAGLLVAACSFSVRGQGVVAVPNNLYLVEGNTNSLLPFGYPSPFTVRYQQVYDASQFPTISNGTTDEKNYFSAITNGGWISDVYFRAAPYTCAFFATVPNVEIHLSTTSRAPDGLSSVFSENTGPDDALVFSGSFTVSSSSCGGFEPYDDHIALSTNFWYDPRAGNLLLDVRVYQGVGGIPPFDAVDAVGDSVSRVWAASVNATSGTADTTCLVTFFAIAPPPTLQALSTTTNYIAIRWFAQPSGFVLQQSSSLGSVAVWQSLPGAGGTNPSSKEYLVPMSSTGPGAFFRLAIPGGP